MPFGVGLVGWIVVELLAIVGWLIAEVLLPVAALHITNMTTGCAIACFDYDTVVFTELTQRYATGGNE